MPPRHPRGHRQVKRRQVLRRRAVVGELTVADHRGREEREQVKWDEPGGDGPQAEHQGDRHDLQREPLVLTCRGRIGRWAKAMMKVSR